MGADSSDEEMSRKERRKHSKQKKPETLNLDRKSEKRHRDRKDMDRPRMRSRSRSRDRDRQRRHETEPGSRVKQEPRSPPFGGKRPIKEEKTTTDGEEVEKQGPNFATSGKLLEDTNVYNGVVIKYNEPPEARKCKKRWRFYVFKGEETLPVLHMHRQSAYLMGKDRKIVDVPIDHPSCSRQHAVYQYRMVKKNGMNKVLPYIIDLGSSNGTYLNNQRIEPQRYYELQEKDMLKFGFSSREYVLLHDQSKDDDSD